MGSSRGRHMQGDRAGGAENSWLGGLEDTVLWGDMSRS